MPTQRTVVTGGTGRLGRELLPRLLEAGHDVGATSRRSRSTDDAIDWIQMDLETGEGITQAVADADVIIHTITDPLGDTEAVDVEGTERLLAAAENAGVSNFVYVSIVGIDDIPYSYYQHKLTAERLVESSDVPSTVVTSTQFHPFVHELLELVSRLPVWPLPTKMRIQPIDPGVFADRVLAHATPEGSGRLPPIGGPEIHTVGELADAYRDARGTWRPIVRVPIPTAVFSAFRAGHATCPDHATEGPTWAEWLADEYDSA